MADMILREIEQLEARIRSAGGISEEQRAQLLGLLKSMRAEAQGLPEGSEAIAEPVRNGERPIEEVMGEIKASVSELEASHPKLTQLTNQVAVVLANMGI
jgi:hypothetical protein